MLTKIIIIFVGSAVLLGSAVVGWGAVLHIVSKSAQTVSFAPAELRRNVDTGFQQQRQFVGWSVVPRMDG